LEEEENNPMKALENRTVDSKREMDILDALQDIRARNARNERAGQAHVADQLAQTEEETAEDLIRRQEEEEDEAILRQVFSRVPTGASSSTQDDDDGDAGENSLILKRKVEHLEPPDVGKDPDGPSASSRLALLPPVSKKRRGELANSLGIKIGKGKKPSILTGPNKLAKEKSILSL